MTKYKIFAEQIGGGDIPAIFTCDKSQFNSHPWGIDIVGEGKRILIPWTKIYRVEEYNE